MCLQTFCARPYEKEKEKALFIKTFLEKGGEKAKNEMG
jgi:hypothetical protein